jgi:hypothetical protein
MPACEKNRQPSYDDSGRDGGVRRHMQKSAADIEIAFATRHEHQRSRGIDCDTEKRNPDEGSRRDFGGIVEAPQSFPCDRTHRDKKKDCIKQRRQNRRAAESVSFSLCWQTLGHRAGTPSEQEAEHVGEVVTRVCNQRQRMAHNAEDRLKDDIAGVQGNAHCKCSIETRGPVRMAGVDMRVLVCHRSLDWDRYSITCLVPLRLQQPGRLGSSLLNADARVRRKLEIRSRH